MASSSKLRRSQPPWRAALSASIPVRLALLALLATLAYGASLSSGVAWDDAEQLSANPAIRSLEQPWRFFTDPQTATPFGGAFMSQYRPLRTLLFAHEFALFRGHAWGFHLVSLLLHGLGAFALARLTRALFGRGQWLGCPNLGECFSQGTATLLILGRVCTRDCGFCAVEHGLPAPLDEAEPEHVAKAVKRMGLRYVVITSVTRDDLPDGGASHFAKTIQAIREMDRETKIEVLVPDFNGDWNSLNRVLQEGPNVLNHNMKTVRRLYPVVRPQADYERSLNLLKRSKEAYPHIRTKSGLMLGLGESKEEVLDLFQDLRKAKCDLLTTRFMAWVTRRAR